MTFWFSYMIWSWHLDHWQKEATGDIINIFTSLTCNSQSWNRKINRVKQVHGIMNELHQSSYNFILYLEGEKTGTINFCWKKVRLKKCKLRWKKCMLHLWKCVRFQTCACKSISKTTLFRSPNFYDKLKVITSYHVRKVNKWELMISVK